MYDSSLKAKLEYEKLISFELEKAAEKGRQKAAIKIATRAKEAGMAILTIAKATAYLLKK